jgi:hypothetical protein
MHEAQRQNNADAATMLYVAAIEALISPVTQLEWRKESVTRRFREGVLSLCADAVDDLLAHDNVEQAFHFRKQGRNKWQRRQLVDHIYDLRSVPTHTGVSPTQVGMMQLIGDSSMRVALLSDLARSALHGYLQGPCSFLAGHPEIENARKMISEQRPAQTRP